MNTSYQHVTKAMDLPQDTALQAGVLTVDSRCSRGEEEDICGAAAVEELLAAGISVKNHQVAPDDYGVIVRILENWCKPREELSLIFTVGGTGISLSDVTPEATLAVADRLVPGIPEAIRAGSMGDLSESMLFRGIAGTRGTTLIVNLPDNPEAVRQSLRVIMYSVVRGLGTLIATQV